MADVEITVSIQGKDNLMAVFDPGRDLKPHINLGPNPCERCIENARNCDSGKEFKEPEVHPHCFPAGTVVSGPPVLTSYTRWYLGDLVEIETRSGAVLSATPNHPVLTSQGWVGAGLLNEGDYVVREAWPQGLVPGDPCDHQQPALIEDVAGTFGEPGSVMTRRVPVTPEDFHGDGADSEVAVVRADGLLRHDVFDTAGVQHRHEPEFVVAGPTEGALLSQGTAGPQLDRFLLTPPGGLCGDSPGGVLLGSPPRRREAVGIARPSVARKSPNEAGDGASADAVVLREGIDGLARLVSGDQLGFVGRNPGACGSGGLDGGRGAFASNSDTVVCESFSDEAPRAAGLIHDLLNAHPGSIVADEIVRVHRYPFSGHVYNLETLGGWYLASSIVVHNCHCEFTLTAD